MLTVSTTIDKHCNHNIFALIAKSFSDLVLIFRVLWIVLLQILSAAQHVYAKMNNFYHLSKNVNPISKAYISQLLPTLSSLLIYSSNWSSATTCILPLFLMIWSRIPLTTRRYSLLRGKVLWMWLQTNLELLFNDKSLKSGKTRFSISKLSMISFKISDWYNTEVTWPSEYGVTHNLPAPLQSNRSL